MTKGIPITQPVFKDQKSQVLWHLENYGTITQNEADDFYGIKRLASRINKLKNMGHDIIPEKVKFVTRLDKKSEYVRYRYIGYNPDYTKPVPDKNLYGLMKKYATAKARQEIKTYESYFAVGKASREALDKITKRNTDLINFVEALGNKK